MGEMKEDFAQPRKDDIITFVRKVLASPALVTFQKIEWATSLRLRLFKIRSMGHVN